MSTKENRWGWRRVAAATGALTLGFAGLVGASTAATAQPGPGQENAPSEGTLTIHKYAGDDSGAPGDGTPISPDQPALEGVEFTIRQVTQIGTTPVDLTTSEGWDAVAALGTTVPEASGMALGTPTVVETDNEGATETQTLPIGLYYVTETNTGPNDILDPVDPFLVTIPQPQGEDGWLYDVNVYPKNTLNPSEATKEADDSGAVKLGDAVSWTITTPALSSHDANSFTSFVVTDDLVDELEFVAGTVTGHAVSGSATDPVSTLIPNFSDNFAIQYSTPDAPGGVLTITATSAGLSYINSLPSSQKLSFTFDTAVRGIGDIENSATVNFGSGTQAFETGEDNTAWGPALVTKQDAADGAPLAGAEFALYRADANGDRVLDAQYLVEGVDVLTGTNGEYLIEGLKAGFYWLVETKAPTGYVLPEGEAAWSPVFEVVAEADVADAVTISIANSQQGVPNLPMTGANGQLLMTIAGIALILVAGGGALAVRNRSKSAE